MKEEYKNHTIINKKLDLYHIENESSGMIFWHKNGLIIFNKLIKYLKNILIKHKYEEVKTPFLLNKKLWEQTGHIDFFKQNMFFLKNDKDEFCIKPMNCPAHICIYKNKIRSYKELPIKFLEFGICTRKELSGSLYGLLRTKTFTQDDTHIFCTNEQLYNEIYNAISITEEIYKIFNFKNIEISFSTRPENKIGDDIIWNKSENIILKVLSKKNIKFNKKIGEGAFYGPKIEFILKDNIGRNWQCGTIQIDYFLSKKLNSFYIDKYNNKKNPIIIHKAILGSIERFIGIITENFNGQYPLWLSPIQIIIINISNKHFDYCTKINNILLSYNIRSELDISENRINYKIKKYIDLYIPYIIICGEEEIKNKNISIRKRNSNIKYKYLLKDFIYEINYKIINKLNDL